ncbi:hypothetical protein IQ276_028965 [Desmonostoc muscorum LEGE 12446]|uniref:Uncharacterized protein n=1 Tax=Desmonostoc muscorum LEGE 12446 TaxID=1828758 RepID=A0A8J6ZYB9_DESMC|nr:hypothetical protein [Desmonostoc muscorum]MCF2150391.1 hypothetical protein [Desmonostoc muscorum LEGE 12446]
MIIENGRLQVALFIIGAFGSLATVVNVAYITCDRFGWCKNIEPTEKLINPCPPILPPGKVCNYRYPQKTLMER